MFILFDYTKNIFISIFSITNNNKIKKIIFPCKTIEEGKLSYLTEPGQTYYYRTNAFYSTSSDDMISTNKQAICITVPVYGTGVGIPSLCRMISFQSTSFKGNCLYRMDTYTFSESKCNADIVVIYKDYSKAPVTGKELENTIGVVEKKFNAFTDNGSTHGYSVMGQSQVSSMGKVQPLASIYNDIYITAASTAYTDEVITDGLSMSTNTELALMSKNNNYADTGDILMFNVPFYQGENAPARHFYSVIKLYDYKTKTSTDPLNSSSPFSGTIKGKVKAVGDNMFAFLQDGMDDDIGNYMEYPIKNIGAVRIFVYTPGRINGTLRLGESIDLEMAMNKELDVVNARTNVFVIYEND